MAVEYEVFTPQSLADQASSQEVDGQLLLAWSCNVFQGHFRVALFEVSDATAPNRLLDGTLVVRALDEAKQAVSDRTGALFGRWDPPWIGGWKRLFTTQEKAFRLWDREGLVAALDDDLTLTVGVEPVRAELAAGEIRAVERFATDDWVTRGVRVVRTEGEPVVLVSEDNTRPTFDFGYDRQDFQSDSMWAYAMAVELAKRLGKPYGDAA